MTLDDAHYGVLRVVRQHPGSTTGQLKRLTTSRLDQIPVYLRDLEAAGLVTVREHRFGNGTIMRRWTAA